MNVPITAAHTFYVLLLLLGRTAGVLIAAPIPGNRPLPPLATLGFSLCLSFALLSYIAPHFGLLHRTKPRLWHYAGLYRKISLHGNGSGRVAFRLTDGAWFHQPY